MSQWQTDKITMSWLRVGNKLRWCHSPRNSEANGERTPGHTDRRTPTDRRLTTQLTVITNFAETKWTVKHGGHTISALTNANGRTEIKKIFPVKRQRHSRLSPHQSTKRQRCLTAISHVTSGDDYEVTRLKTYERTWDTRKKSRLVKNW